MMRSALFAALDRFEDWYVGRCLPLWAGAAADPAGRFYECLDFAGRPLAGRPRRTRVQCRQIHVFADAARRGWLAEGERIAQRGFARLLQDACPAGGARGCIHLIDDAGRALDDRRDLYDQAFLLLACAARLAADDPSADKLAGATLAFLDRELAAPQGGYFESDRREHPRRQNPHMHLFEAMLALYAARRDRAHLARARALESLFELRFFDRRAGLLREFFGDDWTLDPARGEDIEPGHMMEWVVLLDRFERLAGERRAAEKGALYRAAKTTAVDAPFLPDAARADRRSPTRARRLWPQTEYLRAALTFAAEGDAEAAGDAERLIGALFQTYLDQPVAGLWCDAYDGEGRPAARDVPASILYHLHEAVCSAVECRHRLRR
jgi:mannose-6-phosphate isomerase